MLLLHQIDFNHDLSQYISTLLTDYLPVQRLSYKKILSLCQDIIYLVFNGRKEFPKHISLAFAIKHLVEDVRIIRILNGLGHCITYRDVKDHENGLALKNLNCEINL